MAGYSIFIDGAAGTTGLRIRQRLAARSEIALLELDEASRKDAEKRLAAIEQADLSILCLPDAAAKEIVAQASPAARICDASTAHRTSPGWVYGFPELGGRYAAVQQASRVSVPGCHATGFLALAAPLVEHGYLAADSQLYCHSLTGYSGGGKQMIAAYEDPTRPEGYASPREYGLAMQHKHLPEMKVVAGLTAAPLFTPIVADYYSGMLVTLPLPSGLLKKAATPQFLADFYTGYYQSHPLITVHSAGEAPEDGFLAANALSGKDSLEIFVLGNEDQLLLAARYDNLGKGASGAAIQCMNLMLGLPETAGLEL